MSDVTPQQELAHRQAAAAMAHRMAVVLRALVVGTPPCEAISGLLMATAALVASWCAEGEEGHMLVEAADFLANSASQYPVARPK